MTGGLEVGTCVPRVLFWWSADGGLIDTWEDLARVQRSLPILVIGSSSDLVVFGGRCP